MDFSSRTRSRLPLVIIGIIALLAAVGAVAYVASGDSLIEQTGETDPLQQMAALLRHPFLPQLNTANDSPVDHAGLNPYGVNTFFEQEVEEWKVRKSMKMLRDAGVHWIRQQMPWADIEPFEKGRYVDKFGNNTWDKYDRMVALAEEYGLEIVARLDEPPNWSRADNSVHNSPPDDLKDYGDFVYTFVNRYKGRIKYYQIWNEPNIYPEWGNRPVDAEGYAKLLTVGYVNAKRADPSVVILAAALAPTLGTPDGYNQSDLTFLEEMYDAGAQDYFDIMSVMGYGLWTGPGDRRAEPGQVNFSRPQLIREIMVSHDDAVKPIWVAEVGWNALPESYDGPATHGRVSEELQARYTVEAYKRAQAEWPWMGPLFFWHFRMVSDESRSQVVYYFRMVDTDFTPRPVYDAFAKLTTTAAYLTAGLHQEDHWAVSYDGSWSSGSGEEALLGNYRVSADEGSSLDFRFRGTSLDLITKTGSNGGSFTVEVDGLPRLAVRGDGSDFGTLLFDLSSEVEEWGVEMELVSGLSSGEHSGRLTVFGDGQVVVDGFRVSNEEDRLWRWVVGLALLTGCGFAAALIWRRA
jgi:hypothetical protein